MRKLGLNRDQFGFLTEHDQVDQFEQLFDRSNKFKYSIDGGASAVTTTMPALNINESMEAVYMATGGTRTITLPTTGNFNFMSVVTVNNTATTTPTVKVGRNVAGGSTIISAMSAGSSVFVTLTRIS